MGCFSFRVGAEEGAKILVSFSVSIQRVLLFCVTTTTTTTTAAAAAAAAATTTTGYI